MAKFRWEHGIQEHHLPITDDFMRLASYTKHDENIMDLITKQATTQTFQEKAILYTSVEDAAPGHDWDHELVVRIARGGELLADFLARHWSHKGVMVFSDEDMMSIVCEGCDETLQLKKSSLVKLED